MKPDEKLQLQAYLDGELSQAEAAKVEALLAADPARAALLEELSWTKFVLTDPGNEPAATVPESREFYWSQIQRKLERATPAPKFWAETLARLNTVWRRALAPSALAAMAILLVLAVQGLVEWRRGPLPSRQLALVENPSEEMGSMTFRSVAEDVVVIWLYDRPLEQQPGSGDIDEILIQ